MPTTSAAGYGLLLFALVLAALLAIAERRAAFAALVLTAFLAVAVLRAFFAALVLAAFFPGDRGKERPAFAALVGFTDSPPQARPASAPPDRVSGLWPSISELSSGPRSERIGVDGGRRSNVKYESYEWHLDQANKFAVEVGEIRSVLDAFQLRAEHFTPDLSRRNRSLLVQELQSRFEERGWAVEVLLGTHHVDCVKGRVAVEIEWHSTDKSFPRDLLNFEQLRRAGLIDLGVIVTRGRALRAMFRQSGKRDHSSTSHIDKLSAMMKGTAEGDCPIVAFALLS